MKKKLTINKIKKLKQSGRSSVEDLTAEELLSVAHTLVTEIQVESEMTKFFKLLKDISKEKSKKKQKKLLSELSFSSSSSLLATLKKLWRDA